MNSWVTLINQTETTYTLPPASVDGDHLVAELPTNSHVMGKSAGITADESISCSVTAVTGYKPHITAGRHFKIDYASRWTSASSVAKLGEYLEEAY